MARWWMEKLQVGMGEGIRMTSLIGLAPKPIGKQNKTKQNKAKKDVVGFRDSWTQSFPTTLGQYG